MTRIRDLVWWYWLLTVGFLGAGLFGRPEGIPMAIAVCVAQIVHVTSLTRDWASFPAQVRIAYLAMLIAGLWDPLHLIHWIQFFGTTVRVLVGYCLLARTLSLAPWNRWQPLSWALIRRTFLSWQSSVPSCGDVLQRISLERVPG